MGGITVRQLGAASPEKADMRGIFAFEDTKIPARGKGPALHIAATPPHMTSEWLPAVIDGRTVGAGHVNMLEASAQVSGTSEGFLRQPV